MSTPFRYDIVSRTLPGDLHTTVSAYLRLRDASTRSILMESSDYHTGRNSRSFIALEPLADVSISHGTGRQHMPDGSTCEKSISRDYPAELLLRNFMKAFSFTGPAGPGASLWGFTSFNAVRYFEGIPVKDETHPEHDAPDLMYILFR